MTLFGSGINFYGGLGESAHKQFIKSPGQQTQQRVSEFAQQTALQYYNMLVSAYADDFKVTCEVIEMMETESKVIFDWSCNFQILKGSSDKYNLNKDYV